MVRARCGTKEFAMKRLSMVLAVMAALALGVTAANAAKGTKPVAGTISKIDGATITVTPRAMKGSTETPADVTVTTTDATTVMIKGEKKTVADLTVGLRVRITLDADGKTATAITSGKVPAAAASAPASNP
jgi:hypothetical protein